MSPTLFFSSHFRVKSYTQCIMLLRQELVHLVNTNYTIQGWSQSNGLVYTRVIQILDGTIQYSYNAELIRVLLTKFGYDVILQQGLIVNTEASYLIKRTNVATG